MKKLLNLFAWIPKRQQPAEPLPGLNTSTQVRPTASSSPSPKHPVSPGLFPWQHTTDQTVSTPDDADLGRSLAEVYALKLGSRSGGFPGGQSASRSHRSSSKVLHIIGQQGVGKSTLARQLKIAYEARGLSCENLTDLGYHEPGMHTDIQPLRDHGYRAPYAATMTRPDVLIVEHLDSPLPKQVMPGDLLIRLERAA